MIFQTVDDVKNKFDRIFPQGVEVRHHFEQWRNAPAYSYNDSVLPPYEFPQLGFNTQDYSFGYCCDRWAVLTLPGTIVGMLELPDTLTCDSYSQPVSGYLLRQGISSARSVGPWVVAGVVVDAGLFWYIGLVGGVHYFFIPSGFSLSADVIPTVYNWPGNYIMAKHFYGSFGTPSENLGMVINSWDGSYRYGRLTSFDDSVDPQTNYAIGLYSGGMFSDFIKSGTSPCANLTRDRLSSVVGSDPNFGLFSNVVHLRDEEFRVNVPNQSLTQFDGYLVTPKNTASNFSPSYTLNTI